MRYVHICQIHHQPVFTRILVAHCWIIFFSLFSHHGPLIVRSAQLFHRSNGFTQLCTRLAVHNQFSQLSVSVFCSAPPTLARFNTCPSSCSGLGSMVSRIPILQICNVVVVLIAVASFQHLPNLHGNFLVTEVSIHVYGSHG